MGDGMTEKLTAPLQQSPQLAVLSHIRHGFGTRRGGVSDGVFASLNCGWKSGDDVANVAENRRRIAATLQVEPEHLLTCYQIHSPTVLTVTQPWTMAERPEADAMVTNKTGLALGILTADCVPLLLADPVARVIGAAHAGWRGALHGVVENTVQAMCDLGAHPRQMIAAIGPCIWQDSYEVSPDFPAPFLAQDGAYARFFRPAERAGHSLFDLPGLVRACLQRAGVEQIAPSIANTYTEAETYYSFRRNTHQQVQQMGSLLAAISLVG
jgi:YfiH family protein